MDRGLQCKKTYTPKDSKEVLNLSKSFIITTFTELKTLVTAPQPYGMELNWTQNISTLRITQHFYM